jgi:hypothetical protein
MTTGIPERLFELLPAHIRNRDAQSGQHLRALMAIIDAERQRIEEDIHQLYDDQFIETCDPWAVAYIADLLDIELPSTESNRRAYVANTIGYRRRKGVIGTLEDLAQSITGWPTVAVEFFKQLATTQHVDHPRPSRTGFARVSDASRMAKNGTAFEQAPRGAEVRLVDTGRGKFGVSNIGLFAWRTTDAPLTGVEPRRFEGGDPGGPGFERYHLHPVGVDFALVNRTRHGEERGGRVVERDVPARLRNRRLYTELEAIKRGEAVERDFFGEGEDPITIYVNGEKVPHAQLSICNLSEWDEPTFDADAPRPQAVVDVERGRLLVFDDDATDEVRADYAYGMLAEVGGGPYERRDSVRRWSANAGDPSFAALVSSELDDSADDVYATLHEAIDAWNARAGSADGETFGIIAVDGYGTHAVSPDSDAFECRVPPNHRLVIVGADWPAPEGIDVNRGVSNLRASDCRPHVLGDFRVDASGGGAADIEDRGAFVIDGALVEGSVTIDGELGALGLFHATLVPERGGVGFEMTEVESTEEEPDDEEPDDEELGEEESTEEERRPTGSVEFVEVHRTVCGPLVFSSVDASVRVIDSVIDGGGGPAIEAPEVDLTVRRSTVLGSVELERLEADDSIFEDRVDVDRRQGGCVRYCYAPPASRLPRTYRCVPHDQLQNRRRELGDDLTDAQRDAVDAQLRPNYVSRDWWRAGYVQLDESTSAQVRTGAEDGAEMGVYAHLKVPQKLANLRAALDEHLRVGMFAGIFFEPST